MMLSPDSIPAVAGHHILIIGAGIGGLCLAQGLQRRGIPFTVYERDPSPDHRKQGYRLRINADGYKGLEACLTPERLAFYEASCARGPTGFRFIDALDGSDYEPTMVAKGMHLPPPGLGSDGKPPAISEAGTADRRVLRAALLAGIEDSVVFGQELVAFKVVEGGEGGRTVVATFASGLVAKGALLVGADGVHSRVRRSLLPDRAFLDTDGRAIYGKTALTPAARHALHPLLLAGTAAALQKPPAGPVLSLFSEPVVFPNPPHALAPPAGCAAAARLPETQDYLYWVLVARSATFTAASAAAPGDDDDTDKEPPLPRPGADAQSLARRLTASWDPRVRAVFTANGNTDAAATSATRITTSPPTAGPWRTVPGVTLLGDAIHAMSPTAGVGANAALMDCKLLVERIDAFLRGDVEGAGGIGDAVVIGAFEEEMWRKAEVSIRMSRRGGVTLYDQTPFEECRVVDNYE
ncbi:hypothetical protein DFJ73DRAFT_958970 [Zopfochytrium polystomum]|nr:hypothetical protein DFJ73DRAFT_958970 [Zopfochytrium polystomum]